MENDSLMIVIIYFVIPIHHSILVSFFVFFFFREYQLNIDFRPLSENDIVEDHQITVCVRKRPLNKKGNLKDLTSKEIKLNRMLEKTEYELEYFILYVNLKQRKYSKNVVTLVFTY